MTPFYIYGTYEGLGYATAWDRKIQLPRAVWWVTVTGTPSSGNVRQDWAVLGGPDSIKHWTGQTSIAGQVRLAADGRSFRVEGSGTSGLDEPGTQYWYVGLVKR